MMQSNSHRKQMDYLLCGAMTTVVNMGSFSVLVYGVRLDAVCSNIIAWFLSVSYAYLANKIIVYRDTGWNHQRMVQEVLRFFLCRAASGGIETAGIFVLDSICIFAPITSKVILSVIVLCLNYLSSEKLVFSKK